MLLCDGIRLPLVSVRKLTKDLNYKVVNSDDRAFVLKKYNTLTDSHPSNYSVNHEPYRIIASATATDDNELYTIDDISRFKDPSLFSMHHDSTSSLVSSITSVNDEAPADKIIEMDDTTSKRLPLTKKQMRGSNRTMIKSARQYLNALEWEHVRLGHCNPELIKYGIKGDIWLGAGVPWTELSNMQMGLCDACMHGRMHALPIYSSLNNKEYDIFEGLSSDYIPYGFSTRSGYTGGYLFTCLASDKPFFVHTKDKTEWKNALIRVINENGPARNPRSRPLRVFQTDYDTVVHSEEFTLWLIEKNVKLQNSAPYKHQQNKAERNIQTIWNMMRASMYYNKAPKSFLEDAIDYSVATYGFLCSVGETRTRDEVFWGQKTDLSQCVPFYASGWYNVTPEEMQYLQKGMKQRIKDKARNCIFLGYTNPYRIEDRTEAAVYVKDSYKIWLPTKHKTTVRRDCFFKCYPSDLTSLLHSDSRKRKLDTDDDNDDNDKEEPYEAVDTYEEMIEKSHEEMLPATDRKWEDPNPHEPFKPYWSEEGDDEDSLEGQANLTKKRKRKPKKKKITLLSQFTEKLGSMDPVPSLGQAFLNMLASKNYMEPHHPTEVPELQYTPKIQALVDKIRQDKASGIFVTPLAPTEGSTPSNLEEALGSPNGALWLDAWETEIKRLNERSLWQIEEPFNGPELNDPDKPIKSKAAFRHSIKPNGSFKFRSRLVGCGYSQIYGKDYDANYSPTAKYKSLCIILHLAAVFDLDITGIDVENAFIEPVIDKEIFMYLPKDIYAQSGRRVKVLLLKSIYGLKQAGDLWYKLLDGLLTDLKYKRLAHDVCVYRFTSACGKYDILAVVYVDDVLFFGPKEAAKDVNNHIAFLMDHLTKLTKDSVVDRYIGVDIKRNRKERTITVSQKPYTQEYVKLTVPGDVPSKELPLPTSIDYDDQLIDGTEDPIQDRVGKLRFLADRTRPEIAAAVGVLGQAAANPSKEHVKGTTHIGQYLKGTIEDGVTFGGQDHLIKLFGFCDANYNPRHKSRLGYDLFLNKTSGAFECHSSLDPNVTHSACESEISALDKIIRETIWCRGFLEELGFTQNEPTDIYTDSKSAQTLIELFHIGSNSAHLVMRLNFLHEQVLRKVVRIKYVQTDENVADIQTKLLAIPKFSKFKDILLHGFKGSLPESVVKVIPEPNRSKILKNILKFRSKTKKNKTNK